MVPVYSYFIQISKIASNTHIVMCDHLTLELHSCFVTYEALGEKGSEVIHFLCLNTYNCS